jgi:hypothetical protein
MTRKPLLAIAESLARLRNKGTGFDFRRGLNRASDWHLDRVLAIDLRRIHLYLTGSIRIAFNLTQ